MGTSADEQRLTALFTSCHRAVAAYVRRRVEPDACDDVIADVFLTAWRRLSDVPEDPVPWLLAVARRVLSNRRRTLLRAQSLRRRLAFERPPIPVGEPTALSESDEWSTVLSKLSPGDREVLYLVAWDELSVHQAAQVLGCSDSAFAMRVFRARQRLARHLANSPSAPTLREGKA